jgi:glycosyltransferase involved in cell wall biosynthesis
VITPVYNTELYLGQAIHSVRAQTLTDWELIVVDDGSTDGSAKVARAASASDPRIRLLQQPNGGVSAARIAGHAASDGVSPYLLFLDADDVLEPEMLAAMTRYLDDHPEVGMAYCEPAWMDGRGEPTTYGSPGTRYVPSRLGVRRLPPGHPDTPFVALFFWGRINPSITLLRRSVYEATGGWDVGQGWYAEDLDLWLKVALRHRIHYVPEVLVRRRIHGDNYGSRGASEPEERRLFQRWLDAPWLTVDERSAVHKAWRLRQRRFLPYLWREWGTGYLRKGELSQALTCYLRSAKRVATYGAARARGRVPTGPVW